MEEDNPINFEQELKTFVQNSLGSCITVLDLSDSDNYDRVINILELCVERIAVEDAVNELEWAESVITDIEDVVEIVEGLIHPVSKCKRGRKKISVDPYALEHLLFMRFTVPKIAKFFDVNERTIFRRMAEHNLSVSHTYTVITDEELQQVLTAILLEHPNTGFRLMKGFLMSKHDIRVTDIRIRYNMKIVDPTGVRQRYICNRAIIRRVYYVDYSDSLWHLDTYMKLIRYKMIVRACIDGKTRFCPYLDIGNNNRANSNLDSFVSAVRKYGVPSRCRGDKGGENRLVARFQLETRGLNRRSFMAGRSVHNIRIERFWNEVKRCTGTFKGLFFTMEQEGILNVEDADHIHILHHVFLPRLQISLTNFQSSWNCHPVSTESNDSPFQMRVTYAAPRGKIPPIDITRIEEVYSDLLNVYEVEVAHEDERNPIRNPTSIHHNLTEDQLDLLSTVDVLEGSDDFGVDIFQRCLRLLNLD